MLRNPKPNCSVQHENQTDSEQPQISVSSSQVTQLTTSRRSQISHDCQGCYTYVVDVLRWDASTDGPLTAAALVRKLENLGYAVNHYVYPPGTYFPSHTHAVDKMDAVVSGRFRITLGADSVILGRGDAVAVPAGAAHSAEVVGNEPVVSLDGIRRT